nr:AEC family transporter [uncultured Clostridium sp.]
MTAVLVRAAAFVAIIIMGYLLKRAGFFQAKDFYLFSRIVIKITLPAAIVSNFSKITMERSLLAMCVIGILCNFITIGTGYITNISRSGDSKAFAMLNMSGYNIGTFTMPFVQSFLSPVGFAATSLFDAGNSVMCTGLTYSLASMAAGGEDKPSFNKVVKKLFSSVPFDSYVVMTILGLLNIKLPGIIISFADTAGAANAFLALLMLGIGFEIRMDKEKIKKIIQILGLRYTIAIAMAVGFYFFAPFSLEIRQTLAIVTLGPVAGISPAFTAELKGDIEMASAINSLSIIISIVAITASLLLLL